uniref:Uncharacterized protein n=1 Tax=Ditylenchus dipsaci TaxID=166011 RepID=A0A915D4T4_9BILA
MSENHASATNSLTAAPKTENGKESQTEMGTDGNKKNANVFTSPIPSSVQEKMLQTGGCTPALTKVRQSRMEFKTNSPSDALMSPCTQLLANGKAQNRRTTKISHPQNVLRKKQHHDFSKKFNTDQDFAAED